MICNERHMGGLHIVHTQVRRTVVGVPPDNYSSVVIVTALM